MKTLLNSEATLDNLTHFRCSVLTQNTIGEIPMGMFPALLRKTVAGRNQPLTFTKERTLRNISIISSVTFSYLHKIRILIKVCSQVNPPNNRKFSN